MWDNAPLLRSLSSALFFCSVLAVLYGAGHYALHQPKLLPIRTVRLVDVPQRVDANQVQAMVRAEVQGNFLTVDIDRLRLSLEKLPWVRRVHIRREFPNRLAVQFEEHQPLAYWNDDALVNRQGEVFVAETRLELPHFVGVADSSAEVTRRYAEFNQQLAGLNLRVSRLALSPRHAWQLQLDNGMVVELGRAEMQARLARFVTVFPYSLGAGQEVLLPKSKGVVTPQVVQVVDMRYRNGFTVRMKRGNA